jgi:hypothetical protein
MISQGHQMLGEPAPTVANHPTHSTYYPNEVVKVVRAKSVNHAKRTEEGNSFALLHYCARL